MHAAALVTLNMRELDRLKVIQAVVDMGLKPGRAGERLGLTVRQVECLVQRYQAASVAGLVSGKRGRPGNHQLSDGVARRALAIMRGFSPRSLKYMRALAQAFPQPEFVQQPVAQLPWSHVVTLLDKLDDSAQRLWYAGKSLEHGWSRSVLTMQIETAAHARTGKAVTNFAERLPPAQSDLARDVLKDPYIFDFLDLTESAQERDIERALTQHITRFLLELGAGFAFVGRQYRLEVGGDEFFIDLLFYHLKLRCYVVVELKTTPFKPEYAGQLNLYLSAIDAQVKAQEDQPTIGLLLCKEKNRLVAEYALRGVAKPMGVAEYLFMREVPE